MKTISKPVEENKWKTVLCFGIFDHTVNPKIASLLEEPAFRYGMAETYNIHLILELSA